MSNRNNNLLAEHPNNVNVPLEPALSLPPPPPLPPADAIYQTPKSNKPTASQAPPLQAKQARKALREVIEQAEEHDEEYDEEYQEEYDGPQEMDTSDATWNAVDQALENADPSLDRNEVTTPSPLSSSYAPHTARSEPARMRHPIVISDDDEKPSPSYSEPVTIEDYDSIKRRNERMARKRKQKEEEDAEWCYYEQEAEADTLPYQVTLTELEKKMQAIRETPEDKRTDLQKLLARVPVNKAPIMRDLDAIKEEMDLVGFALIAVPYGYGMASSDPLAIAKRYALLDRAKEEGIPLQGQDDLVHDLDCKWMKLDKEFKATEQMLQKMGDDKMKVALTAQEKVSRKYILHETKEEKFKKRAENKYNKRAKRRRIMLKEAEASA